jgi:hypothetical protein
MGSSAVVPVSEMSKDPALEELVDNTHVCPLDATIKCKKVLTARQVTCWMGPGRNIVGYCIVCCHFSFPTRC